MALLPNGYTQCRYVVGVYDTGVYPSNTLTIDALLEKAALSQNLFLFGARNTNSNTSQGQLNLNIATNNVYFGYSNARVAMGNGLVPEELIHIHVDQNVMDAASKWQIYTATGVTTAFTGTRTMYIGALNNAGAILWNAGVGVYGFTIYDNGTKVKDLIPCFDETNEEYGLYDLVDGVFLPDINSVPPSLTFYSASIGASQGGGGYIMTEYGNQLQNNIGGGIVTAVPEDGYVFKEWQDGNGNVLSLSQSFDFKPTADTVLVPVFSKITTVELNMNYFARVLGRHGGGRNLLTLNVVSAEINDDALQRSTSTITVEDVPDTVGEGQGIFLYNPKNGQLYAGVVQSIEGNVLTCREPLSYFDRDYLFKPTTMPESNYNVLYGTQYLMQRGLASRDFNVIDDDALLDEWLSNQIVFETWGQRQWQYNLMVDNDFNSNVVFPAILETASQNLEDFLFGFSGYGIFIRAWLGSGLGGDKAMVLAPYFYRNNKLVTLSDNLEYLSDVELISEQQEDNILVIYNEGGTALRGIYGVTVDGKTVLVDNADPEDLIAYNQYNGKIIMSNDNINTILAGNLSNAGLNHKITFSISFDGMITFDMVKVGTPCDFYIGDRLYNSVITAVSYNILPNQERIADAKITLGNVRTSLTSKLNLGKVR